MTKTVQVASLFSGAGGLDLGFNETQIFDINFHLDLNDVAIETLRANKGNHINQNSDIVNEDIVEFANAVQAGETADYNLEHLNGVEDVDFVIGGPPCQPFSAAARRTGGTEGTDSEDGQLFEAYCDLISEWQPEGFLFENVYGITANEEDWLPIKNAFEQAGYTVKPRTLDAADYGVPQHRERTFIVGIRDDINREFLFPRPTHGPDSQGGPSQLTAGDVLADLDVESADEDSTYEITSKHAHLLDEIPPGLNYSFYTEKLGHPDPVFAWRSRFSDYLYKADPNSPVRTLKAQPGAASGPFHWDNRKFTEAELKRLQSFPDDYQIEGGYPQVVKQIGNSVPPRLAEVLAKAIAAQLFDWQPEQELEVPTPMPDDYELNFRSRKRTSSEEYQRKARQRLQELGLWDPNQARKSEQRGLEEFSESDVDDQTQSSRRTTTYGFDGFFTRTTSPEASGISEEDWPRIYTATTTVERTTLQVDVERIDSNHSGGDVILELASSNGLLPVIDVSKIHLSASQVAVNDIYYLWSIIASDVAHRTNYEKFVDVVGHYSTTRSDYSSQVEFSNLDETPRMRVLSFFSNASHCNTRYTLSEVAQHVDESPTAVVEAIEQLRQWRYEIRSPSTHSTLESTEDQPEILCTYPFPDMNETSHFEPNLPLTELHEQADKLEETNALQTTNR
ncbi:DNA cytosine methyltransferase [Halorussus salinus]|uniref:DNA cytosine methyltransferase n=1 Tax=Halorussus salinus TaxID=1364935 RepID=UPI001091C6A9|nr:DNA cytosine methyltransferase [Halorussus salinus]